MIMLIARANDERHSNFRKKRRSAGALEVVREIEAQPIHAADQGVGARKQARQTPTVVGCSSPDQNWIAAIVAAESFQDDADSRRWAAKRGVEDMRAECVHSRSVMSCRNRSVVILRCSFAATSSSRAGSWLSRARAMDSSSVADLPLALTM